MMPTESAGGYKARQGKEDKDYCSKQGKQEQKGVVRKHRVYLGNGMLSSWFSWKSGIYGKQGEVGLERKLTRGWRL